MILLSTIIELFEAEPLAQYRNSLLPSHLAALAAMKHCRTSASPMMLAQCPDCDHKILVPHACGHRSCPHCQHHEREQWLARQLQKLVPGQYVLVTFTLPAPLRALAFANQSTLFALLIQCAWQTPSTFARNDKQLQGTAGAIAVLHTHSPGRGHRCAQPPVAHQESQGQDKAICSITRPWPRSFAPRCSRPSPAQGVALARTLC